MIIFAVGFDIFKTHITIAIDLYNNIYEKMKIQLNNSFSLQQISSTGNLDPNLISRQYKQNLMAGFLRME